MSTTGTRQCPECEGRLRASGDETVCGECGLVVSVDRMDRGPEWRSFPDEETDRERTGAPLTRSRHDRGLSTEMGHHGDTLRLTGRKRRRIARLRRQHNRTRIGSKAERNQVYAFTEIRRLVTSLGLPESVRESACRLFESAQNEDLLRGRSLEGFAAAAVYATCRVRSISRTIEEVTATARASRDELTVAYDALNRELGLPTGPVHPREYVPRFATRLDLPTAVEERAREFAGEARERGLDNGRNPCGVAAACLYAAAEEHGVELTQGDAADVADVTPVTLRSTYYGLTE
jgi:transcription initiation factor TFIIB